MKKIKLPKDTNQRAKKIIEIATGEVQTIADKKNPKAVAIGRLGGLKGGKSRASVLSPEERSEIARKAATVRWKKTN